MARLIIRSETRPHACQGHEAVQRTAVEQVPAGMPGDRAADRAFARTAGSIDGNDRQTAKIFAACALGIADRCGALLRLLHHVG